MNNLKFGKDAKVLFSLLFTQAISLVGTRMTTIALGIWLYQKTGRTMDLLLIPLFNELPSLLLGNYIGTFVDRIDRKKTIILSDLGQAIGTLLLFISISSNGFNVVHLYAIVFFQGMFTSAQEPAADSTIAQLTTPENRTRINGIKELSFPTAGILAPVLAGVFYVSFGIGGVILIDLFTFVVASVIVSRLQFPQVIKTELGEAYSGTFFQEAKGGFGFLKTNMGLLWLVLYMAIVNLLINGPLELVIPYILERTGSEIVLSSMLALMSVATLLMSLLLSIVRLPDNKISVLLGAMGMTGIGLMLFGTAKNELFLALVLFLLMMPLPLLNVVFKSILQEKVPGDLQGRVFGTAYQLAYGVAPLSFLVVGGLVDQVMEPYMLTSENEILIKVFGDTPGSGMGITLFAAGVLVLIVSLIFLCIKAFRYVEQELRSYN